MKNILLVLILLVLGNKISFSQNQFEDSILLSNKHNSVFVVRICQNNEENKYIINRTRLLYRFVKINFQYDTVYQAHIANIIRNKKCLTVPNNVVIPDYFKRVIHSQEVDSVSKFGKEVFLEYFIQKNGYIKRKNINTSMPL